MIALSTQLGVAANALRPHDLSVSCLGQRPLRRRCRFGGCAGWTGAGPWEWGKTGCRPAR
jgi:hypothetical protein